MAVILPLEHGYARHILRGIVRYARTVSQSDWHIQHILPYPARRIHGTVADGVIASIHNEAVAEAIAELGRPAVNVSDARDVSAWPKVVWDNLEAGRIAARHLVELGHRRFVVVGDGEAQFARRRHRGFCEVLAEHGIAAPALRRRPSAAWLRRIDKPAAIFAVSDQDGEQAMEACRAEGVGIPRQVAVVAVNDDDLFCELTSPSLSSIAVPGETTGFTAARVLDDLFAGRAVPPETTVHPLRLVARRSSELFATDDSLVLEAMELIRDRVGEPFNVSDLARHMDVDRRTLERRFRAALARSPLDTIHEYRLKRARQLLETTTMPLDDIAEQSGYANASRLVEAFRRRYNETPGSIRRSVGTRGAAYA